MYTSYICFDFYFLYLGNACRNKVLKKLKPVYATVEKAEEAFGIDYVYSSATAAADTD